MGGRCAVFVRSSSDKSHTERTDDGDTNMAATDDDVIAKIFGKMDVDKSGLICQAEMSAAFVVFDRDGR